MKRSRRSEYDKKRNRSKKHSERKFGFSSKTESKTSHDDSEPAKDLTVNSGSTSSSSSSSNSNTIDRLKSFEVDENQEKKYTHRKIVPKSKSGCFNFQLPIAAIVIIFIIKLVIGITNATKSSTNWQDDPIMQKVARDSKKSIRNLMNKNSAFLILGQLKPMRQVVHLKKDSLFPILPNVNVHLFKGFHLYDATMLPTTQLFAKFSKYYFFYDRIKKKPTQSMTSQWILLRNKLTSRIAEADFSYKDIKKYTYKGLNIEEKKFTILTTETELQGVSTLIEDEDIRYFFHFISKEKKGHRFDFHYLKKYLDYYLKIK